MKNIIQRENDFNTRNNKVSCHFLRMSPFGSEYHAANDESQKGHPFMRQRPYNHTNLPSPSLP